METNDQALDVIHNFLWSWENDMWRALTEYHCDPENCRYSDEYLLKCYRELLELIIEEWLNYKSAQQVIFNCWS